MMTGAPIIPIDKAAPTRAAIVARMRHQRAEIEQYFDDVAHWNRINPDQPIDGDPEGLMRTIATALDSALAREANTSTTGQDPQ